MFLWERPPQVIGHRGAPRLARENTMASFRACVDAGVGAFELDARLSADGVVVVHHDPELGRILPGAGEIEALRAELICQAGAPTLEEVLRAFPHALVDLELKADAANTHLLPQAALEVVEKVGALDRVVATSFDPETADAYAKGSGRPAGVICAFEPEEDDLRDWPRLPFLAVAADVLTPGVLAMRRPTLAWTVNETSLARTLLGQGVRGIVTDRPDRLWADLQADAPGT